MAPNGTRIARAATLSETGNVLPNCNDQEGNAVSSPVNEKTSIANDGGFDVTINLNQFFFLIGEILVPSILRLAIRPCWSKINA